MAQNICDVVVIGAGILGCAVAHEVANRGLKVSLLDAGAIGQGTSGKEFQLDKCDFKNQ